MRLSVLVATLAFSVVGLSIADGSHASIKMPTDIAPQPLGSALQTLAKDRGFQVVYESAEINPLRTKGATGDLTSEGSADPAPLGHRFTYQFYDDNAVSILPVNAHPRAPGRTLFQHVGCGEKPFPLFSHGAGGSGRCCAVFCRRE